MAYEIKLEHRTARIELLNRSGNKVLLAVDDRKYELDVVMVEKGVYSILYNGNSYNVELIEGKSNKEISDSLFISIRTVHHHRASIMKKLDLKNRI